MLSKNHGSAADKLVPIMQMRGTCLPCAWQRPLPSDCHISTLQYSTSLNYTIVSWRELQPIKETKTTDSLFGFLVHLWRKIVFIKPPIWWGLRLCRIALIVALHFLLVYLVSRPRPNIQISTNKIREALDNIWSNLWLFPHIHASPFSLTVMAKHTVSPNCDSQFTRLR